MTELTGRKAISHERILDVASRAVRRQGYHGVNVTEVMREAGLTHGGFYAHFASREALLQEAVAKARVEMARTMTGQLERLGAAGASPFKAVVDTYLSMAHVLDCENGCPVSLLCGDMPRQAPEVAEPSRHLIHDLHRLVARVLPASAGADAAWTVTSALLGAVQLARALGDGEAARAVIADTKGNLLARYDV